MIYLNLVISKKTCWFLKLVQKKIVLLSIKNNLKKNTDIENLGAEFYGRVNYGKNADYYLISDTVIGKHENFVGHFLHGLKLKSYTFKNIKLK